MKTRRSLNFNKGIDEVPKIITRLSNYLLNGELSSKEYNALIGGINTFLKYYQITVQNADLEEIKEMLDEAKRNGVL